MLNLFLLCAALLLLTPQASAVDEGVLLRRLTHCVGANPIPGYVEHNNNKKANLKKTHLFCKKLQLLERTPRTNSIHARPLLSLQWYINLGLLQSYLLMYRSV